MALLRETTCDLRDPMGRHPVLQFFKCSVINTFIERWGGGVETQKNVRGEIGGWGRVPFNETYAPLLSTIYDGA